MMEHTKAAVEAICTADPTIPRACVDKALDALAGKEIGRMYTIGAAAEILKCHRNTVLSYMKCGALRAVSFPGRVRSLGVTEESLRMLLQGRWCAKSESEMARLWTESLAATKKARARRERARRERADKERAQRAGGLKDGREKRGGVK